jgi:1-acyl-sn-glycerol-3-phosphate acyltransferase
MDLLFPHDTYKTPEKTRPGLADRIFFKSRWCFHLRFIRVILRYRSLCVKKRDSDELWVWNSFQIFKAIERSGGRFHIEGFDNLRKVKEPVVVVSNHMSAMETMIYPAIIFPFFPITYVVKEALVKGSAFGPIMRSRKPIAVGRVNPREDFQTVLTEGCKILEKGISIVIFPQATRYLDFNPENFNSLGIKLARRAGVKVVPAALKTDFWGNSRVKFLRDFGPINRSKRIHMAFGEPMAIEGNGSRQHQQCIEFIQSHCNQWKE